MEPFKLTLSNGATLTGLHHRPAPSSAAYAAIADEKRPLFVAIHGGGYSSSYFDADPRHTASLCSTGLGVPVVAIDRPLYEGSTSFYPLPEGKSYHQVLAHWLHHYILPAVWNHFGQGCRGGMVLHCHSLATPSAVMAAGLVAQQQARGETPEYTLVGMTISGFGTQNTPTTTAHSFQPPMDPAPFFSPPLPAKAKDDKMIPAGTVDPSMYALTEMLDKPRPFAEVAEYSVVWVLAEGWRQLCGMVEVPILIGLAEHDPLWMGTEEHVREFASGFTGSDRVEGSVVKGAPHCIELSYLAQGWYARCFGWALECAAAAALKKEGGK